MKKTLLALLSLIALTAACHERRQEPVNEVPTRTHAGDAQHELQQQQPPAADQAQ